MNVNQITTTMRTLSIALSILLLGAMPSCSAQVKNARTLNVKVDGDCGMCEKTIERVGSIKGESEVDWDVDSHMASVTYDSTRTDLDAILQRIAHAGYDTERFLAPKEAYDKLPGCCQYDRTMVHAPLKGTDAQAEHSEPDTGAVPADHGSLAMEQNMAKDHLQPVFDAYFLLKDALVASNASEAQHSAKALVVALRNVQMDALEPGVHGVWMKVMEPLVNTTGVLAGTADLAKQRRSFTELTGPMAELAKASPPRTPIYLDHCPMYEGGADWLSTDKAIKNPYYGSMMMTCGSVKETITK